MKTSKIIFSIAITAAVLFSTATMAQSRVIITTRIIAPPAPHYHPHPPICGRYYAPAPHHNHYRHPNRHPQEYNNSCHNNYNNNNYRNGNVHGRDGNRNGQGRGYNPRHY